MQARHNIIEEFQAISSLDVTVFLEDCKVFLTQEQYQLIGLFTGEVSQVPTPIVSKFNRLIEESNRILDSFRNNTTTMKDLRWWELLEIFEDIDTQLATLRNLHKWTRSSLNLSTTYSAETEQAYSLRQNETLESVARRILNSPNPEEWVNIALKNSLLETDYNIEDGGASIKLYYTMPNREYKLLSVVDILTEKSIYGKDLDRKLQFVTDTSQYTDLKILSYDQTIFQAVNMLVLLKKGDNPLQPTLGLQSEIMTGTNRASLNFPVINRQMQETFATDDTLKGFTITKITQDQDNVFIDFKVYTRLNEVIEIQQQSLSI